MAQPSKLRCPRRKADGVTARQRSSWPRVTFSGSTPRPRAMSQLSCQLWKRSDSTSYLRARLSWRGWNMHGGKVCKSSTSDHTVEKCNEWECPWKRQPRGTDPATLAVGQAGNHDRNWLGEALSARRLRKEMARALWASARQWLHSTSLSDEKGLRDCCLRSSALSQSLFLVRQKSRGSLGIASAERYHPGSLNLSGSAFPLFFFWLSATFETLFYPLPTAMHFMYSFSSYVIGNWSLLYNTAHSDSLLEFHPKCLIQFRFLSWSWLWRSDRKGDLLNIDLTHAKHF